MRGHILATMQVALCLLLMTSLGYGQCEPTSDGSACESVTCPVPTDDCQPTCVNVDPQSGQTTIIACECGSPDSCHALLQTGNFSSCVAPDNGSGVPDLPPPGCEYQSPEEVWMIVDGLPPSATIELDGPIKDFQNLVASPGGSLGGNVHQCDATLDVYVTGTGDLAGFNRHLAIPVALEIHASVWDPVSPGVRVAVAQFNMIGELFGDPDFCTLRVRAGQSYGLPSPGQFRIIQLPSGDFAVESFFDVTYEIEFEGCPGSQIDDLAGTTTATIRLNMGILPPLCLGGCPSGEICEQSVSVQTDGTIDYCCNCVLQVCEPLPDGSACKPFDCPVATDECLPRCFNVDPESGSSFVIDCECVDPSACHAEQPIGDYSACVVSDNGSGTADLPPVGCKYQCPDETWMIIDGLPAGSTIELDGPIQDFYNVVISPGGTLGGEVQQFDATLDVVVTGTGDLAGFNRHLAVPVSLELHSAPRMLGNPVQTFRHDLYNVTGELFGDPDFCTFRVRGGAYYGLPSPGQTTLRQLPDGDFAVESFFDVTYQIEFEGCPGSQLEDLSGTTTATIRVRTGILPPICLGDCEQGEECETTVTVNLNGTIDYCCQCVQIVCEPLPDGSACRSGSCVIPGDDCVPVCLLMDPVSGQVSVTDCMCKNPVGCHIETVTGDFASCVVPDAGGTADLPPLGCQYLSPDDVWLIEAGLPPATTIELDGPIEDFTSIVTGSGGSLGGEWQQFDATLDVFVTGTGDLAGFNRHLAVPVSIETHTAPRSPGDPVQTFATDMYSMIGELFGDPDFCTFRIHAGTNLGLPSPGGATLRELPSGDWAVESFFDITYQIEFEGCPGSQLDDLAGTTTGTIRVRTGVIPPICVGSCPPGKECKVTSTVNLDGTIEYCCTCEGAYICGDADGNGIVNIADAVYLISYIFGGGPAPDPLLSGDADCNEIVNIADAVYLISYIFGGGPAPCASCP